LGENTTKKKNWECWLKGVPNPDSKNEVQGGARLIEGGMWFAEKGFFLWGPKGGAIWGGMTRKENTIIGFGKR